MKKYLMMILVGAVLMLQCLRSRICKRSIIKEALEETIQFINAQKKVYDGFKEYVENNYLGVIIEFIAKHVPWVTKKDELAKNICSLFDTNFTRVGYLGIAIAGYGTNEIFPHMVHLKLSGILNRRLRYEKLSSVDINERETAAIIPLAQTDVMDTFIRGYNGFIINEVINKTPVIVERRIASIPETFINNTQKCFM